MNEPAREVGPRLARCVHRGVASRVLVMQPGCERLAALQTVAVDTIMSPSRSPSPPSRHRRSGAGRGATSWATEVVLISVSLPPSRSLSLPFSLPPPLSFSLPPILPPSLPSSLPPILPPSLPFSLPPSLPLLLPPSVRPSLPPSLPCAASTVRVFCRMYFCSAACVPRFASCPRSAGPACDAGEPDRIARQAPAGPFRGRQCLRIHELGAPATAGCGGRDRRGLAVRADKRPLERAREICKRRAPSPDTAAALPSVCSSIGGLSSAGV